MKNFLAYWPNKSLSILSAVSYNDLFWRLDIEGDPCTAIFAPVKEILLSSRRMNKSDPQGTAFRINSEAPAFDGLEWCRFSKRFLDSDTVSGDWIADSVESVDPPFVP